MIPPTKRERVDDHLHPAALGSPLATLAPWHPGTLAPLHPGTLAPWLPRSLAPLHPCSLAPWLPRSPLATLPPWLPGCQGLARASAHVKVGENGRELKWWVHDHESKP